MKVKKFTARTMQEAMNKVKEDLGNDAVILQTRSVEGGLFGLFPRKHAEITAASDVVPREEQPRIQSTTRPKPVMTDVIIGDSEEKTISKEKNQIYPNSLGLQEFSAESSLRKEPDGVEVSTSRLSHLEEKISLLTSAVESLVEKSLGKEIFPGKWAEVMDRLRDRRIGESAARKLIENLQQGFYEPESILEQDDLLIRFIEKEILSTGGIRLPEDGQKVVVLIGPTGVGKTTTLAKIATEFLRQGRRIGFITADTYRLAAVEQLQKYANIMGLSLETVYTTEEMAQAIARQSDKEILFIDTAGRSQHNREQMDELQSFVAACQPAEVHLLLSATTKKEDLKEIVERFSVCPIDRLILTKVDESTCFGPFYEVVTRTSIPFSYITTGQNVPEDIEEATANRIARLILRGGLNFEEDFLPEPVGVCTRSAKDSVKVESENA